MKEINKITSRENERLKYVRRVRDGKESDSLFIEGVRLVKESLRSEISLIDAFISTAFLRSEKANDLISHLYEREVVIYEVAESIYPSIADTKSSQGVILIGKRPQNARERIEENLQSSVVALRLVIFLNRINNPSNLGAIVRIVEAAGAAGVITSENSVDAFSAKAIRGSMGSGLRVPVWENAPIHEILEWARSMVLRVSAADADGENIYTTLDWSKGRLMVFGSEAHGLEDFEGEKIDEIVAIPMRNGVESLNLGVSCGIILFEADRQSRSRLSKCPID